MKEKFLCNNIFFEDFEDYFGFTKTPRKIQKVAINEETVIVLEESEVQEICNGGNKPNLYDARYPTGLQRTASVVDRRNRK